MKKIDFSGILYACFPVLCILIVVAYIAFQIYLVVEYGNKPASEIPGWVWWWMLGGKES